jgi:hypothetical protein
MSAPRLIRDVGVALSNMSVFSHLSMAYAPPGYTPSGCIWIPDAIATLFASRHPDLAAELAAIQAEAVDLYGRQVSLRAASRPQPIRSILNGRTPYHPHPRAPEELAQARREQLECVEARLKEIEATRQKVHLLRRDVSQDFRKALGDGALNAIALTHEGYSLPLPVQCWRASAGWDAVVTGIVSWWLPGSRGPMPVRGPAFVECAEFDRWHVGNTTIGGERRLTQWLVVQMRAAPSAPRSKAVMQDAARAASFTFSEIGFGRSWSAAIEEAPAPAWSRGGRRKAIQQSPG